MKNSKRFLAIIILAIVAFVSCKKDNENILNAKREPVENTNYTNYCLDALDIVYCLDSYLGLGFDHVNLNSNDQIICWKVKSLMNVQPNLWRYYFHQLQVEYGQLASAGHQHDD